MFLFCLEAMLPLFVSYSNGSSEFVKPPLEYVCAHIPYIDHFVSRCSLQLMHQQHCLSGAYRQLPN